MIDAEDRVAQESMDDAPDVVAMGRRRPLSPISRETLHDRVYAALRRSLIHGAFATGETLRIQLWRDGDVVSFNAIEPLRNVQVVSNGRAQIT